MLRLSADLSLPLDAATRRMAVLAMSGAGKSNLAVVMAERMYEAGIPWVAIDPKGDWYGVRSSSDGKKPGLSVPVFGGLHGDVPLEPTAGRLMAALVAGHRLTCVLDVSEFDTREQMFRFLHDFAEGLLRLNKHPLHLFLEEADDYLPQKMGDKGSGPKCLAGWQRLVKRGRFRGIGCTMVTQRSAALNKDALNMAECLFALRVTAPHDRRAIEAWVVEQGLGKELVASLPSLADGEGWAWSPAWLKKVSRVQFDRRSTFDSGRTPTGQPVEPAKLADIDLSSVSEQIAATVERAKDNDPAELKRKIRELERQVADKPKDTNFGQAAMEEAAKQRDRADALEAKVAAQTRRIDALEMLVSEGVPEIDSAISALTVFRARMTFGETQVEESYKAVPMPTAPKLQTSKGTTFVARVTAPIGSLTGPQTKIVNAIAWWNSVGVQTPDKLQIAFVAGYTPGGGSFNNNMGALRSGGMINYPSAGCASLTPEGSALAQTVPIPPSLQGFQDAVMGKLTGPQRRLLSPLIEAYPDSLSTEELASRSGYTPNAGSFNNTRGSLRTLGLVTYPSSGLVRATDMLFPEGLS